MGRKLVIMKSPVGTLDFWRTSGFWRCLILSEKGRREGDDEGYNWRFFCYAAWSAVVALDTCSVLIPKTARTRWILSRVPAVIWRDLK